MNDMIRPFVLFGACLLIPSALEIYALKSAASELESAPEATQNVVTASPSEDNYCTPELKRILRRVAGACGLLAGAGRGCQPADAKAVAQLSGEDFNKLFLPLSERARIIQFDSESSTLDAGAQKMVEEAWGEQRGASFFFAVARASPDGGEEMNQALSAARAEAVLTHLETRFQDPELKQEVGLLWLGEEYAQLPDTFCDWTRSREGDCNTKDVNRSTLITWIDCSI